MRKKGKLRLLVLLIVLGAIVLGLTLSQDRWRWVKLVFAGGRKKVSLDALPRLYGRLVQPGLRSIEESSRGGPEDEPWIEGEVRRKEATYCELTCQNVAFGILVSEIGHNDMRKWSPLFMPAFTPPGFPENNDLRPNLVDWPQREWLRWNWLWERGLPTELLFGLKDFACMGISIPVEAEADSQMMAEFVLANKGLIVERELQLYRALAGDGARVTASEAYQLREARRQSHRAMELHMRSIDPDDSIDHSISAQRTRQLKPSYANETAIRQRFIAGANIPRPNFPSVESVQAMLSDDTALIEFTRYLRVKAGVSTSFQYGAIIITKGRRPVWVKLGGSAAIDDVVAELQNIMRKSHWKEVDKSVLDQTDVVVRRVLNRLFATVWSQVDLHLPPGTRNVFVVPDGALNFLPFACLMDGDRFLSERLKIQYLSSGRQLLRPSKRRTENAVMEVFAAPDFDLENGSTMALLGRNTILPVWETGLLERGFLDGSFEPLGGTLLEAEECKKLEANFNWLKVKTHLEQDASKQALIQCRDPLILHIGTHGIFLREAVTPLHRSGIALSGANKTIGRWNRGETMLADSDGIVFASELAQLSLKNTWLVVLSACDTGVGSAVDMEGVQGLGNAILQAGAENALLSLWPVDDDYAPDFFRRFYRDALSQTNAIDALRTLQAKELVAAAGEESLWRRVKRAGPFVIYGYSSPIRP